MINDCNCSPHLYDGEKKFEVKQMISLPALATGGVGILIGAFVVPKILKKKGKRK